MEKIKQKFKEECAIDSGKISNIWKFGVIIVLLITMTLMIKGKNLLGFIIFILIFGILYLTCLNLFRKLILEKIYKEGDSKNRKKDVDVYKELDIYQKDWI